MLFSWISHILGWGIQLRGVWCMIRVYKKAVQNSEGPSQNKFIWWFLEVLWCFLADIKDIQLLIILLEKNRHNIQWKYTKEALWFMCSFNQLIRSPKTSKITHLGCAQEMTLWCFYEKRLREVLDVNKFPNQNGRSTTSGSVRKRATLLNYLDIACPLAIELDFNYDSSLVWTVNSHWMRFWNISGSWRNLDFGFWSPISKVYPNTKLWQKKFPT